MALNKLYYVYGLDTSCFYTDEENQIEQRIIKARVVKSRLTKIIKGNYKPKLNFFIDDNGVKQYYYDDNGKLKKEYKTKYSEHQREWIAKRKDSKKYLEYLNFTKAYIAECKQKLKAMLSENKRKGIIRTVREDKIYDKNKEPSLRRRVSIFDSALTRYLGLKEREFNTEIVIVKVYYFDVAESIVTNGFYMNGYKYRFFSASAGQIRTKKLVAVREDLLDIYWNSLTAGLTIEKINQKGGMNINKYLAYLALCNSATDLWEDFDIDRCIVVNDFENTINGTVDYIDEKTYNIERIDKDLNFTQTDGVGMILPTLTDKNFMVRLPWIKGLLAKFDFVRFIKENNATGIVTDIYGTEHNIIDENIQIIFTKSQLKMWKFFDSWQEYKDNFKKYNCTAGICNKEEDEIPDSVINYQMIQTLSDMTDDEIKQLAKNNNNDIVNCASDLKTMLKVFGAVKWNRNKTGLQKCLEIYPELLNDTYCRQTLRDLKVKMEKDLWSARFDIGGKYTFVIPDLYAFCEWLFLDIQNPRGLLKSNEVCCRLFKNNEKLDCLRSPHLYLEHAIRQNNTMNNWFDTKAIYISCQDLISIIVMCDYDGDRLLVTNNTTLINVAERNLKKYNIVPLFYNMSKASAKEITPQNLFEGLKLAYNGGNIGTPSNDITKIWNSGAIDEERLTVVKWLVAEVNFTIDYAKTLYKPKRPKFADKIIKKYTKAKVPHFFRFAKDKTSSQVERISECTVDRIEKIYPKCRLSFNFKMDNIGTFNYKVLMSSSNVKTENEIINKYKEITKSLTFARNANDKKMDNYLAVFEKAKQEVLSLPYEKDYIIDNIIQEIFSKKCISKKKAFWFMFGEEVYQNIVNNLDKHFVLCERCGKRFYKQINNEKYCDKCKGYQKMNTKTLICVDCGKEFTVNSNVRRIRCDECYKKERKLHNCQMYKNRKNKIKKN